MARRRPRPHRELSRYLCKLHDWAQAQSYAAGLPAVCHKWSGALPPLAYATTRHTPRLGALPSLRWQRKRLPCQPHLAIIYAISNGWSDPMASILPKYRKYIIALTRSLPRDVYIRRQNDHPGGQGRIYTSHLNFVSAHLSKPGHRRGCCCMSPRCLLRQFVDRCLLFWAFFIEKTVLLCFARFLSKWRETALWLFPDATSWYELYV